VNRVGVDNLAFTLRRLSLAVGLCCAAANAWAAPETAQSSVSQEQLLPTERMVGPLPSLEAHCDALLKTGIAHCDAEPSDFGRGWRRGERAPLLGATTLRVSRTLGPHTVKTCHVALRTASGWYISAQTTICAGQAVGETRNSSLSGLRWADEAGFGVLAANVSQERRVQPEEHRWWGQLNLESETFETQVMLCGLGRDQTPQCSAFLTTQCGSSWSPFMVWEKGRLLSDPRPEMQDLCSGVVLPRGAYALPFVPGRLPFHQQLLLDDSVEAVPSVLPAPVPSAPTTSRLMYGPFASLDAYCADPPSFLDPLTPQSGDGGGDIDASEDEAYAEDDGDGATPRPPRRVPDPQLQLASCDRRWGSWNSRQLTARGAIQHVELLRIKDSIAGAQREYCRVAVSTAAGVFVSDEEEPCQGVVGPGRYVSTRLRALSWLTDAPGMLFKIEIEQSFEGLQRFAMVCSVGASGVPSCGPWHSLQCQDEQAAVVELDFAFRNGAVERARKGAVANPNISTYLPCSEVSATQPLLFP
jgi:hypothetical protein